MQSDTLPYTLFLILIEVGLGATIVVQALDMRGKVNRGFLRATMLMIPLILALATLVAFQLEGDLVEGYRLDAGPRDAIAAILIAMTALSGLRVVAVYRDRGRTSRALGGLLSLLAVAVLVLTAVMLRLPAWGMGLVFLSLLAGSLAVGLAAVSLLLGHWYLVTPRLPARPLNEVTFGLLLIVGAQVVLLSVALALPVNETPQGGRDLNLTADVTFWLRIVVGLALPLLFGWMAWSSSRMRAMMSATGLLYLVVLALLAGEIAARALLFDSARPI